ncbi:MAG TPA: adenosylcobalamin-dependent ribonucleoside-diphosphate reductase [Bacteroidia bacterium]|nr:adenosylcobalamin-dependent ribonucleoside-diphosphate reductase [Bacteroidia bacterium]HRD38461.1 adenosylcobalamin-dependent ribonucleoside-diphosphate reductase [Bacteroidia bacterium]
MHPLNHNAIRVLESRYLLKNSDGSIVETPEQLFKRVAHHIANAEHLLNNSEQQLYWEKEFFAVMSRLEFLPNSPTLMNAGLPLNQLSACFVLPVEDSIADIFTTLKNTALIQQSGGGTGFNFSALRHNGDFINSSHGYSTGPISFMKIFDAATDNIKQGGKRRGANMGILNIDHPDIEEFIELKNVEGVLSNFNISVGITDAFMNAVEKNADWELKHPISRKSIKSIAARALWNKIISNAWLTGDPGLIFLDTINESNPTPKIGAITCTNPCGEVPLLPYEACNLGSIDVAKFYNEKKNKIDYEGLEKCIVTAIRFLDNVIEVNNYVIPEIKTMVKGNRKIGLGIMGWAELLIKLETPYASEKAVKLGEELMAFINEKSFDASQKLAEKRGVFKNWDNSIYNENVKLRNATRTSIAPTGTISIIAGTSSSIEPLFALAIHRENVLNNETLTEINEACLSYLKRKNLLTDEIVSEIKKTGSIQNTGLPNEIKDLFKTSLEIEPYWHIQHQVAFQKHTDNAVSKTINLPGGATVADIENAYLTAWKNKAKGITIYRYGSKSQQVLHSGTDETENQGSCKVCVN